MAESNNPRVDEVDTQWETIQPMLNRGDGYGVRDILQQLRFEDRGLFNALYWRTDDWLKTFAGRAPLSEGESKMGLHKEEVGPMRLRIAIRMQTDETMWPVKGLNRLLTDIAALAH